MVSPGGGGGGDSDEGGDLDEGRALCGQVFQDIYQRRMKELEYRVSVSHILWACHLQHTEGMTLWRFVWYHLSHVLQMSLCLSIV